jgi:hypothetical protein
MNRGHKRAAAIAGIVVADLADADTDQHPFLKDVDALCFDPAECGLGQFEIFSTCRSIGNEVVSFDLSILLRPEEVLRISVL